MKSINIILPVCQTPLFSD